MQLTTALKLTNQGSVFLLDQFFEPALAQALLTLCSTAIEWQARPEYSHWPGRTVYAGSHPLIDTVVQHAQSSKTVAALSKLADCALEFYGVDLWQDQQGYKIDPHQDYMDQDRFCHVQIYITDHTDLALGTAFYSTAEAHEPLFQIPYRHNSGYFMATGQTIWHGLPPIHRPVHRHSVQIRYRTQ